MTILDLIDEVAAREPDRTAVVYQNERLSYRQLVDQARLLANDLITRGVGRERLVCVALEPSPWAPIAMLGVLRAGGAYVPLDPGYPRARLQDMLDQVGEREAPLVLTTSTAARNLPTHAKAMVIELDRAWPTIAKTPTVDLPNVTADALAYVIFTSGSTGRPKGVMVPHRGLANLVREQNDVFAIGADSVVLQFAPLSFDASVSEVFTSFAAGATLCLAPRDELVPGPRLVELAKRCAVTVATLPPSSLSLLEPADFPTLRTVVSAGEACSVDIVMRWAPGRRFINAYGPTEVTVCATMGICEPNGRVPGIGEPLRNTTLMLLDDRLEPVERGKVGEIFVGGVGVTRGYLGRPDLTAERFLPDPTTTGARIYRTGDLARYHDNGALEYMGRTDHQVKVRGHRIELGEVEAVLRTAPRVRDALVVARELRPGDMRLIAYVVADPDLDRTTVRAVAEGRLPAFARPTDLVVLDDWPRSPAGKIDRKRLPDPVRAGSTSLARNATEFRLTEIWQDVLGVSGIGPDDDFFELGGHSLLAIRMLSRVRGELDIDLPLSIVAEHRTVAALAKIVASRGVDLTLRSPVKLRTGTGQPLFLVPPIAGSALAYLALQRRMSADRPLYAFYAPGLDGKSRPIQRFEDLARHYIDEMLAIKPRGPFLLGGWSMGGAVVMEMACQLAEQGHDVPTVLLIEASAPTAELTKNVSQMGPLDEKRMAYMYVNNFGRCFGVDLALDKSHFASLSSSGEIAQAALHELRRVPQFPPDIDTARLASHLAVFNATGSGFMAWSPARRYAGRIVHFLAREGHPDFGLGIGRLDWTEFAERPVETVEVSGNHFSVVNEPHVSVLGAAFDRVLETIP